MSDKATSNPGKSVAFCSPDRSQDGKVRIVGDEIMTENESAERRRLSLADSDTDTNREEKVPFSGLYPVVFICLKQTTRPRIWCLRMIENPWFERLSMMVILMNCVTLGLYEPCQHNDSSHCGTQKCAALEICDHFVFAFFAVEMLIKMVAMGVWGKLGYLGDKWNRLDAAIVFFGIVEYAVQMESSINFTPIRTIRVLRPLRAINRVASMRILVMLLLDTLPMLGNVLLLCSFVFFIFGIVAVQLWAGLLRQRCFFDPDLFNTTGQNVSLVARDIDVNLSKYYNPDKEVENICSQPTFSGTFKCNDRKVVLPFKVGNITCNLNLTSFNGNSTNEIIVDDAGTKTCVDWNRYYTDCRVDGGNPFQGAINFDNIMYAWVAIFQVISLEGWVDIMYYVMDAHSFYSFIYFIMLIVVGSFFMINLCLVVIATQFSETKQREQKLIEDQRLRFKSNDSTLASYSPPGNTYEELLKYISHIYRKNKRRFLRWWRIWKQNREEKKKKSSSHKGFPGGRNTKGSKKSKSIHLHHHHHHHHHHYHISNSSGGSSGGIVFDAGADPALSSSVDVEIHPPKSPNSPSNCLMITDGKTDSIDVATCKNQLRLPFSSLSRGSSVHSITSSVTSEKSVPQVSERRTSGEVVMGATGAIFFKSSPLHPNEPKSDFLNGQSSPHHFGAYVTSKLNCPCSGYDVTNPECFESEAEDAVDDASCSSTRKTNCVIRCCKASKDNVGSALSSFRTLLKRIVDSRYYQHCIMAAILVNTLSMGIEHHNQPETLTLILETSNVVFTVIFGLEMLSKLVAYGVLGYIVNLYNVFDAGIVIISICEIATDSGDAGNGSLSVLRTFRLLRVLKLVRFLPALRRQLVVLMKTMDNVATFMMLLTLFIFIFSILGMHLFGCKFCRKNNYEETECDRKNFDSLLWACVTVFQILTQEDWNVVLYNGMDAVGPLAAVYFITLMTIGNYVLFNLLVAILVEGFQAECYSRNEHKGRKSVTENPGSILAKKYTEKMARSLGLQTPFSRRSSMQSHHDDLADDDVTVELCSQDSDDSEQLIETMQNAPVITITGDSDTKATSCDGAIYHSVPIITHTFATPTNSPTPSGSPSNERFRMGKTDKSNFIYAGVSNSSLAETTERRMSGPLNLSPISHPNSKSTTRQRSTNSESRRSSVSSTFSRAGSWKLMKPKTLPLDQQFLVSWEDNEYDREEEDLDHSTNDDVLVTSDDRNSFDAAKNEEGLMPLTRPFSTQEECQVTEELDVETEEKNKESDNCNFLCCRFQTAFIRERRDWPLYVIPPRSKIRQCIAKMVASKWFDYVILLFIFANCVTIAMEKPTLDPDSTVRQTLDILNYIFTVVFTIEMMLKVIAHGFCIGPHTYMKSGWNVLDFLLVMTSLIDVIITSASNHSPKVLGMLRVFRLLRALRPLRVISRAPGLKLVVQTLISSLKPIGNIVLICCAFFIIFGILGVQIFKGKFYYCDGDDIRNITDATSCEGANYTWKNRRYNFDDLGQALMSLFVLSSKDGWVEIMYNGIDAVGVDKQPIKNYNPVVLLYFISFLLIVGFFVINMFVGVVVENFHRCREEHEQQEIKRKMEIRLRKEEKLRRKRELREEHGDARRKTFRRRTYSRVRYNVDGLAGRFKRIWKRIVDYWKIKTSSENFYESYGPVRRKIYNFCTSRYFELGVSAVIGINIVTMACEHYNQPEALDIALKFANYVFTAVFVLEAILKLIALGGFGYFSDLWNHMDMAIVILSIVGIVIEDAASADGSSSLLIKPTIVRFMRVLRIARVLKLLKVSKGIRSLLETVFHALPQVGNLGLLFLLLFFIYAALGVELFGTIKCDDEDFPCEGLGRLATFEDFGIALLTLFRISTGDNWNGIMKDTLRPNCDNSTTCTVNCCVSPVISPIYFVTFVMMAQFVLVNVVIAVLMKQLEDSKADSSVDDEEEYNDDFDSDEEKDAEDDVEDDQIMLRSSREDVTISDELNVAADVIETSSASAMSSATELCRKNTASDTADTKKEFAQKEIEDNFEPLPSKDKITTSTFPEENVMTTKSSSGVANRSIFVALPPPPPLASSNTLHVSGCKSSSASPARIARHGSLPVRTGSLNLPTSSHEGSSTFCGVSHLPLQSRNSDPAQQSAGRNSADSTKPSAWHRRITRHFSDNPLSLRPNSQRVHHHHHYHIASEPLSKSTCNISTPNADSTSVSKANESTTVSELLSKSANNVSNLNPSFDMSESKCASSGLTLPVSSESGSTVQSISKSANNLPLLTPSTNLVQSKRIEASSSILPNTSFYPVSQTISKSTNNILLSNLNSRHVSESETSGLHLNLPKPLSPNLSSTLNNSTRNINGFNSTGAKEKPITFDVESALPNSSNPSAPISLSKSVNTESNLMPTLSNAKLPTLLSESKPNSNGIKCIANDNKLNCSKTNSPNSSTPVSLLSFPKIPKSVNALETIDDCASTPNQSVSDMPKSKMNKNEENGQRNESKSRNHQARANKSRAMDESETTNANQNFLSSKEKWVDFSNESES